MSFARDEFWLNSWSNRGTQRDEVDETVEDRDLSNINAHAGLYTGRAEYYGNVTPLELKGKEQQVVFRIRPERVVVFPP